MTFKARVCLLDDDELITSTLSRSLKKEGYEVLAETSPDNIVPKIKSWLPDVLLLDINLPGRSGIEILQELKNSAIGTEVIMLTAYDAADLAVKAMKLGAADYLTKPFDMDELKIVVSNIIGQRKLKQEVDYLRRVTADLIDTSILGESSFINELKGKIARIAQAHVSTILITGESGTGKELASRYIHHAMHDESLSGYAPFIGVNCASLPETLLESELFGYEKGAFTDAKADKKGLFEMATGGTILLDEIGEMQPGLQSKLLRVLENRKIRRLGGKAEINFDATVIATTNKNLPEAVKQGEFRMDLYYRLNAFSFQMAPLRERKQDIPLLAGHFLVSFAETYKNKSIKSFSPESEKMLVSYPWPGNVRELKNVVERLVVLESAEVIHPHHLPRELLDRTSPGAKSGHGPGDRFTLPETGISFDDLEKDLVKQALDMASHNRLRAAKLLNMTYDAFRYKLKKFELE
jgi:DNA-binding NtrC family response regulator